MNKKFKEYAKKYTILINFDPKNCKEFKLGWFNVRQNRYCVSFPRIFQLEDGTWDFSIDDFETITNISAFRIIQAVKSRLKSNPEYERRLRFITSHKWSNLT